MNKDGAKQLLIDYRPELSEPAPELREALALVEQDPELNEWFSGQQRFHTNVRKRLRSIEVPAGLKARILKGRKIVPLWRQPLALSAMAAAFILMLGISTFWLQQTGENVELTGYENRMVGFALREYRMDVRSEDPKKIRDFLAKKGGPADYILPRSLEALSAMGGARLSWQGKPVSMLCYRIKENEIAYLFVMNETALNGDADLSATPEFGSSKGLSTARWKRDSNLYLLAAPLSENEVRSLVQDLAASL